MPRPFAAQRAAAAAPPPTLTLAETRFLARLARGEPVHVGRDMPLSVAIRLSALGFILISGGHATAATPAAASPDNSPRAHDPAQPEAKEAASWATI